MPSLTVYFDENLRVLAGLPDACADLIYIDPPFNTGKTQKRTRLRTEAAADGDRVGFQGKRYRTVRLETKGYSDKFDDFLAFIEPRILHAHRILKNDGSLFFHLDYREIHYCKVLIDSIFGRDSFMNEIIWAYDYGGRSKKKWPAKHDTILWYARDPEHYTFNYEEVDRIPYMAPGLVGAERPRGARRPPMSGGTPSSAPTARKRPDMPRKSRSASSTASSASIHGLGTCSAISLQGAGRSARLPMPMGGIASWLTITGTPSRP